MTCSGRLRHGVVAIGGESTGTTLTTERTIWELKLSTEAQRRFAAAHNKESVTVKGTVQKVAGVERADRWIIDVRQIAAATINVDRGTKMDVVGRLESIGDRCSDGHELAVRVGEQTWPLAFTDASGLKPVAETSIGLTLKITGLLEPSSSPKRCAPGVIRVQTLDPS